MSSLLEIAEPIFRITDPIASNNSIDRYEDIEYEPVAGTTLNNSGGDIRLYIETQDSFTHPSESFLIIEGRLIKANNNSYGRDDLITLTNNGVMHLFKKYSVRTFGSRNRKNNVSGPNDYDVGFAKIPGRFL